jgi:hypothetical protein
MAKEVAILAVWQDSDNDIVFPNFAQGLIVVVIGRHIFRLFVLLVEKGLRGNIFRTDGGDPADCVIFRIRHNYFQDNVEAGQAGRPLGGRGHGCNARAYETEMENGMRWRYRDRIQPHGLNLRLEQPIEFLHMYGKRPRSWRASSPLSQLLRRLSRPRQPKLPSSINLQAHDCPFMVNVEQ